MLHYTDTLGTEVVLHDHIIFSARGDGGNRLRVGLVIDINEDEFEITVKTTVGTGDKMRRSERKINTLSTDTVFCPSSYIPPHMYQVLHLQSGAE